jgi:hypothetical protein
MHRIIHASCALLFAASCQSTSRDVIQTGHVLGDLRPANDHVVDVRFDNVKIEGEASGISVLGIFEWGPSNYSNGLEYKSSTQASGIVGMIGGVIGSITSLIPDFGGRIRSAAVREACDEAQCDLLGFPMFYVDETNYFLWKEQTWRVVGFPGHIKSMTNTPARTPSDLEYLAREGDNVTINVDAN